MNTRIGWCLVAAALVVGCGDDDDDRGTPDMGGTDGAVRCTAPETSCDGICVDTSSDDDNCGACGTACGAGESCAAGVCGLECGEGLDECSAACFDLDADRRHCGECDNACAGGEVCSEGGCTTSCAEDLTDCSGSCRDTDTDRLNCGGCGTACADGEICSDGACEANCAVGQEVCGGACTDVQNDRANCGACGTACDAGQACLAGLCQVVCPAGQTECGGSCVDLQTSEANCGACANACGTDETCTAGVCGLECPGGLTDCSGSCTSTANDPANCGACGTACASGEACLGGSCTGGCGALTECSGSCTDTSFDPMNCGACGTDCTTGLGTNVVGACTSGSCASFCAAGTADCNSDLAADGCEIDTQTDVSNCGGCGIACTLDNATAGCAAGGCTVAMCDMGFGDCDSDPTNGCEADLTANDANCGICGNACGGGEFCVGGVCDTPRGDTCANAIALTAGMNSINYIASELDYLTTTPSCVAVGDTESPDLVFTYTPTATAEVSFTLSKNTNQRHVMVLSDGACGTINQLECESEFSGTEITLSRTLTAGTTYYLYVADTSSGSEPLPSPLEITVTEFVANCSPGMGGLLDGTYSRVATGASIGTEYYVVPDDSPTGFVYIGGTSETWRVPKTGGSAQDVEMLAGLTTTHQGYDLVVVGNEIFTLDSATSSTGRLYRISTNGGTSWLIEDYADFGAADDDLREIIALGTTLYTIAEEDTDAEAAEMYSIPTMGTPPVTATEIFSLSEGTVTNDCNGLAADATYFYAACDDDNLIIRINRTTGAVETVTDRLDINFTRNAIEIADTNGDNQADALYVQVGSEEIYYVCTPQAAGLQFTGVLADWSEGATSTTGNYGMGMDPTTGFLWAFDDDTDELILVQ